MGAISSAVEHYLDTVGVTGSIPVSRTEGLRPRQLNSNADVAQLVAHHLAKVRVASSSLVIRSTSTPACAAGVILFRMTTSVDDILGPVLSPDEQETRAAMAMTLFGAFGRNGTSGDLGNEMDSELLQRMRAWADVVLVSSGTVTAEEYGPSDTPIAVLSRSLDIDPSLGVFSGRDPIVLCPEQSLNDDTLAPQRSVLEGAGARFLSSGDGSPSEIIEALHRGLQSDRLRRGTNRLRRLDRPRSA